jgi:RNA recognition motif-containing protein
MKVNLMQCIIISVIFSVAGYVLFETAQLNASLSIVVAASLLISGIVTPWLASLLSSSAVSQEHHQTNDDAQETSTLYVGNLPYKANEDAVKAFFENDIKVQSVRLMKDRKTGKRKGYGFIEIINNDVDAVIQKFNDSVFLDRTLKVRPAKDKIDTLS